MGHNYLLAGLTAGVLLSSTALAEQSTPLRQLGTHQHGIAELNLAVEEQALVLELITPANNLLGFEHQARSAADQRKLSQTLALLNQGTALFRPTEAAACKLQSAEIDSALMGMPYEHEHENKPHGADHSEFHLHYRFHCQRPAALSGVEVRLWEHFEGFERIHGQLISPRGQQRFELGPNQRRVTF